MNGINTQGALAILTLVGAFALLGVYVVRGESPDATVVGLIALPLGAVIGFYFGHTNGTTSALASAATALATTVSTAQEVQDTKMALAAAAAPLPQPPASP